VILDYGLNIANISTIHLLKEIGAERMTLSVELSLEELQFFEKLENEPIEIFIYGRVVDMTLKNHPFIKENGYILEDMKGKKYPTKVENGVVSIYHHEPMNHFEKIREYTKLGIKNFRMDFFEESEEEIRKILNNFFSF